MLSEWGCGGQKVPDGGPITWSRGWFEAFKDHKMASSRLSVSTGPNKLVSKHVYCSSGYIKGTMSVILSQNISKIWLGVVDTNLT